MTEVKNGKIVHTIISGTDSAIVLRSGDLPIFDEIRMDVKKAVRIQANPLISLSNLNGGIMIESEGQEKVITIPLSNGITEYFKSSIVYFDIKFRIGDMVSDIVIPGEIFIKQSVTKAV